VAPTITLLVKPRLSLAKALRRGVPATIGCSEACTYRATLLLDARTAKRLHIARRVKMRQVARARLLGLTRHPRSRAAESRPAQADRTPVLRLKLSEDAPDSVGARAVADEEGLRDLPVRPPSRHTPEQLQRPL
jgi:hypothetical protein